MANITIRPAQAEDSALILHFIVELAIYERAKHEVQATVENIEHSLFGDQSSAHALICSVDDTPVGFAVYFFNYSTWLGKHGLYLEDLYITPEYRGGGAGKRLLKYLAQHAVERDCGRFEWSVLDWNEPAIQFYESFGAKPQSEWVRYRLAGDALLKFAQPE